MNFMKTLNKIILLILLIFAATAFCAAETAPDVSVTVKDSKTKEAIGYATVELLTVKDSVITGGMTDAKGYLTLPCKIDSCKMRIQYLGYKTYEATVANRKLGEIFLEEDAQRLNEVTVTGSAQTTKVDRDVFIISNELRSGTSTARELLGKLNGVIYNPYDQSIMVNGSTNILILIDGIEKDQNMAKTLSPDRIDRVEVIKDPVGKYSADGYKAVINIITKKDFAGIDVNANFNPMFNFTNYNSSSSVFPQENSSMNILYTYKKVNLYGSYSGNYANFGIPFQSIKQYGDLMVGSPAIDDRNPKLAVLNNSNNFTLGGDYLIKPDNTLSLELNYNANLNDVTQQLDLTNYLNGIPIGESNSTNTTRGTGDALRATATYRAKWNEKSNFEANFRYQHSMPTNRSSFTQDAIQSDSYNTQGENFYRLNLDYIYQFTPKFSMDLGYGTILDNYRLYQNGETLKQDQTRNRPSLYLSYAPAKQLSMKVGGMVEFFHQTYQGMGQDLSQSQTAFLPFVNIQYSPLKNFSVTAKYHAWPSYPNIGQLSPFTAQLDTLTWSVGNPALKPSNYQETSLQFTIFQRFTIEPFYGFDNSNIQQYLQEENGQYYQSSVNADKFRIYGLRVNFTYPLMKTLFWQNWMDLENVRLSYNDASSQNTRFMLNSFLYYSLPKLDGAAGIGLQKFITKNPTLQGYTSGGNDAFLMLIQKNFFKKRLSCSLIYIPPVKMFLQYTQDTKTETPNYYAYSSGGLDLLKNLIILQINYHFNSGKQVNIKKSSLDNESSAPVKKGGGLF